MLNVESGGAERAEPPQVFFDLETTGLDQNCEIVQLAAVSGDHSLNLYVVPRCRIQRGAAQVTGFRVRRQRLYQHHRPVLTNSLREVLVSFIAFLRMLGRPLLVGHNIRRFDCPVMVRVLEEFDLRAKFELSVSGCVDTLPLAREMLKHRGLKSFGQEALVSELLGLNYKAHDALGDVRALQTLYSFLRPTPELVLKHTFTLDRTDSKAPEAAARTGEAREAAEQRPLWEHFTQAVSLTGEKDGEPLTLLHQP